MTAYFDLCAADPSLGLRYSDVPSWCMWEKDPESGLKRWRAKRDQTEAIGRLGHATPSPNSERYYIRLLLLNRLGVQSFEHLRTVDGVTYDNFHLACIALDILDDDQAHRRTMLEMEAVLTAYQLRRLFARLLAYCHVADPVTFWEEFQDHLCADFVFALSMRVSAGDGPSPKQLALASISRELEECGLCLTNFNLVVEGDVETLLAHVDEMHLTDASDVLDVPLPTADELQAQIASLNTEQRVVFDAVREAVRD